MSARRATRARPRAAPAASRRRRGRRAAALVAWSRHGRSASGRAPAAVYSRPLAPATSPGGHMTRCSATLRVLAPLALLALTGGVSAQSQTWSFDQTTTGQDLSWTSPTAVAPNAAVYASSFVITKVEVDVKWSFITLNDLDVTGQVPPESLSGSGTLAGPAPVELVGQPVVVPPPPETPALSALLSLGLDASGHGYMTASGVQLGTMQVDL